VSGVPQDTGFYWWGQSDLKRKHLTKGGKLFTVHKCPYEACFEQGLLAEFFWVSMAATTTPSAAAATAAAIAVTSAGAASFFGTHKIGIADFKAAAVGRFYKIHFGTKQIFE
jgi:hypothetical protein